MTVTILYNHDTNLIDSVYLSKSSGLDAARNNRSLTPMTFSVSDAPPPASAEDEAARLYPYDSDDSTERLCNAAARSAHSTCAGMYTGEIEKGREAIDILKALCALKKHKDTVGKDEYYETAQPEVWKIANNFLDNLEKKKT